MISGASEEELDIAHIRVDIMIALDAKYGNYDLLDKLDKYQENDRQMLISFLKDKIQDITNYAVSFGLFIDKDISHEIDIKKQIYQEVLDFVNKGER